MDRLTSLRAFREVVEAGGFSAAADKLGISAPMVSKHVARLERELGARLLNRSSRHLSLTEAGSLYYEQCREALDVLQAAEAAIGLHAQAPRGQLRVSAPQWFASARFAQALRLYRDRYPEVLVDVRLENRKVDLVAEGYDLAFRATPDPSPTLIVKPLATLQFVLAATPAWLAREGGSERLRAAAVVPAIVPTYVDLPDLELAAPAGRLRLRLEPVMRSNDSTLTLHAVHAGIGAAFLPVWLVGDDLASGRLVPVLPGHSAKPIPLFAAYASRRYMTPKLRSFIDHFVEALAAC